MREVLFRGKRVNNGEWVYGGIIPLDTDSGYVFIAEPFLSASTLPVYEIIKHHTHLVIPETVGQFTGLYDKNGKKIFEGDIVDFDGEIYYINYVNGVYRLTNKRHFYSESIHNWYSFFEVIGNIYDDFEMLEGGVDNER